MKLKKKILVVFIFLILLILPIVLAEKEINLGPKLEICVDSHKNCYIPETTENILNDKTIILKFSIINDGKIGWVCWNHWRYRITIEHEEKEKPMSIDTVDIYRERENSEAMNYCLEPKQEFSFFVPFKEYNSLKKEERNHLWTLTPSITIENLKCFRDYKMDKEISCKLSTDEGKRIKFDVAGEIPKTGFKVDSKLTNSIILLLKIIIPIVFAVLLGLAFKATKKKRGKFIFFTIICVIVEFILLYFFR